MGMILRETGLREADASQEERAGVVRDRLRILLELAVAIGRREGLLGTQSNEKTKLGGNCDVAN